jgi:hypothetical protein
MSASILLQKSKVASVRIFDETLNRETVDDSSSFGEGRLVGSRRVLCNSLYGQQ